MVLYIVTMRSRLAVDAANLAGRRGYHTQAARRYDLALDLKPDATGRHVVVLNRAAHDLGLGRLEQATAALEGLVDGSMGGLSLKHEAAACQRQGDDARAVAEFNETIDLMPSSIHGVSAVKALERRKRRKELPGETEGS